MHKIKLKILGLSVSQTQSGAYALVLSEDNGERRIPIIIGPVEAQAIAIQLEGLKPPRPLTHDLFKNLASAFDISVTEVVIYKLEEGIFYSELICKRGEEDIKIDSRTSDAVALAIRFKCPIYASEEILQKAGIVLEIADPDFCDEDRARRPARSDESEFSKYTIPELNNMLTEAIGNEDYERASTIRDEIDKREK